MQNKNYRKGKIGDRYRKVQIDSQKNEQKSKKEYTKIKFLVLFLFIVLAVTIGGSYALFSRTFKSEKTTMITAGTFDIEFKEGNKISIKNATPMSDAEGMTVDSYTFSIENKGTINAKYNISLEENIENGNALDKKYIKYSYRRQNGEWSEPALLSEGLVLEVDKTLAASSKVNYELKMWLTEEAPNEVQGKEFNAKIVVSSVQDNLNTKDVVTPIIKLNGDSVINVQRNTLFADPGVSGIVDNKDTLNINDVVKTYEYYDGNNTISVNGIDTSKLGVYYIYYKITDSEGNEGCTVRSINVYDVNNHIPTINLNGNSVITINAGDDYTELSATAMDDEDGNITSKIVTVGKVNTRVVGTYVIKYIVEDSDGNTASVARTVIVNKKGSISIKIGEYNNLGREVNVPITISAKDGDVTGYYVSTKDNDAKPLEKDYEEVSESNFVKIYTFTDNGTYYIWAKDSNYNVTSTKIEITGIDRIKPVCKFEDKIYL